MNLRDSLNNPDHGGPLPDTLAGREDFLYATAYAFGYAEGRDLSLATSTNGRTLRIHDLRRNTRSATILRAGLDTPSKVRVAVLAQLDGLEYWQAESEQWGADPWLNDDDPDIHRWSNGDTK